RLKKYFAASPARSIHRVAAVHDRAATVFPLCSSGAPSFALSLSPPLNRASAKNRPDALTVFISYDISFVVTNDNNRNLNVCLSGFYPPPQDVRVLPGTGVKLRIGRCGNAARDAEQ